MDRKMYCTRIPPAWKLLLDFEQCMAIYINLKDPNVGYLGPEQYVS